MQIQMNELALIHRQQPPDHYIGETMAKIKREHQRYRFLNPEDRDSVWLTWITQMRDTFDSLRERVEASQVKGTDE